MTPTYKIETRGNNPAMTAIAQEIARNGMPDNAEIIYDERNRLFRIYLNEIPYIVKAFRRPNAINSVAYVTIRKSKARRSYLNALRLENMGFDTPRPEAYMEVRYGMRLHESYYICRDVASPQIRNWERRRDSDQMLAAFADDIVRLHACGVWHKDFSPGNILVSGDPQGGYRFYYIDLNRMKFEEHNPDRLIGSFGRMHDEESHLRNLARHYAEALRRARSAGLPTPPGIDPDTVETNAVEAFRRFWAAHNRHQRLKQRLGK